MNDYCDGYQIYCIGCGHKWVLISDKKITKESYILWLIKAYYEHTKITEKEV